MTFLNFIAEVETIKEQLSPEAQEFLAFLKEHPPVGGGRNGFTENGEKILRCMQEHEEECNNVFNAKEIAEYLFMPPRSVSGSIRKLINEGFVMKIKSTPTVYKLTDVGKSFRFDNEEN